MQGKTIHQLADYAPCCYLPSENTFLALQVAHASKDILIPAMPCLCTIIDKSDISRLKY